MANEIRCWNCGQLAETPIRLIQHLRAEHDYGLQEAMDLMRKRGILLPRSVDSASMQITISQEQALYELRQIMSSPAYQVESTVEGYYTYCFDRDVIESIAALLHTDIPGLGW